MLPSLGIPPRRFTSAITPTNTSSSYVPGKEKSSLAVTRHNCFKVRPSKVLMFWRTSIALPEGVFSLENRGNPSRLISTGMSWGCITSSRANSVGAAAWANLPMFSNGHPHLFQWTSPSFPMDIPIFSNGHPHLLGAAIAYESSKKHGHLQLFSRCLIAAAISRQRRQDCATIGHPHLFHWPSPYPLFPLRNPGNKYVRWPVTFH